MTNFIELTYEPLKLDEVSKLAVSTSTGGLAIFAGTTRDHFEGKRVLRLEYEAYNAMAVKEMEKLCDKMRSKWPTLKNIAVYHR